MYTMIREVSCRTRVATGLIVLSVAVRPALAQESRPVETVPGAADLAGALLRSHPYLFDAESRAALDEVNRQLREASSRERTAANDNDRQARAAQSAAAATRLLAILEKCPRVIRVSLAGEKPSLSATAPVVLPGDAGGLLFRIDSGSGRTRCATPFSDLAEPDTEVPVIPIDAGPTGTTWSIATLKHVPAGVSSLVIEFRRKGRAAVRLPLDVRTPPEGRLKVSILAADTGKSAPAMIRLIWKTNGRERPPSNAVELNAQFDRQAPAGGRQGPNLPGRLGGYYWCMPGPCDMAVPPGEWEIAIRRGVEHVAVFDTFTVKPGGFVEKTYKPRRWIDMRKLGWYSGDDHVHAQILSDDDAARLMAHTQAEDVHLVNVVKMGDIYRTYFQQRGFGKDYRVIDGDYILVPGQECPRTFKQLGHTLSLNLQGMVRDTEKYYLYDTVFDAVHKQGGVCGYAHVGAKYFHVDRDMSINIPKGKVDFAEVLQFARLGTELYYDFLDLGCKLTASAGSDVPWGGTVGEVRTYAFIGKQPFTADAWFEAFGRGRTFVTDGPMLDLRVDEAYPGDQITIREGRKIHVKARAFGDPEVTVPTRLEIVCQGEVIRTAESTDASRKELSLEFDLDAGDGFWIAARAWAGDGRKAHTTPVYVVRPGLRFWRFDAVDELIRKRLASLDEVETIVREARKLNDEGKAGEDRYLTELASQGPELLDRIEAARRIYADLKEVAAKERPLRAKANP